ncbi:MAG: neutral zinc metallopeptidase [Propionicimonas sp.]
MTQQPWGPPQGQSAAWPQPIAAQRSAQQWPAPTGWPQPNGWPQQTGRPQYQATPGVQPGGFQYPQGGYQPPKRRRPFRSFLMAAALVIGLGFFLVSLMQYLGDQGPESEQSTQTPAPGQPSQTTTPTSSAAPSGVAKPDTNPPEIPSPRTYEQAEQWLVANAIYSETVPVPTNCTVGQLNPTTASVKQLENHLNNLTGCLVMVWQDPVTRAGFQLPRPPVTVYTEPITTACGTLDEVNAVYCAGDQRIYYAKDLYRIFPPEIAKLPFMVDMVIGHEFGHGIQARTGILVSSMAFEQQVSKSDAASLSRRLEQQADCLSAQFLNSVAEASAMSETDQKGLKVIAYNLGDDVLSGKVGYVGDHGSGKARQRWFTAGLGSADVGVCNTYTVDEAKVR